MYLFVFASVRLNLFACSSSMNGSEHPVAIVGIIASVFVVDFSAFVARTNFDGFSTGVRWQQRR